MKLKTWQAYLSKLFIKNIFIILFAFFGIYVLLDLMTHLKELSSGGTSLTTWFLYYLATLSRRLDILLPFSILIATIRCLYQLGQRGELIAMLAGGTSRLKLMTPFIIISLVFSGILIVNYQFALPWAISEYNSIRESDFSAENIEDEITPIRQILLEDSTRLIYNLYDPMDNTFYEVYWIKNPSWVYHIKVLSLGKSTSTNRDTATAHPIGKWVDEIKRNQKQEFQKTNSWQERSFPEMRFDLENIGNRVTPSQEQSISRLLTELVLYSKTHSSRAVELKANLLYRLTFPLLCLVAFLGPAPYLLQFRRQVPILMIYLVSIAALFCLNLFLQAIFVVARYDLIGPGIAILVPWALILFYLVKRFNERL